MAISWYNILNFGIIRTIWEETTLNILELMNSGSGFWSSHLDMPGNLQKQAKLLCWKYNQTSPADGEARGAILQELLGTCHPLTFIEPSFHCDYGFNIHTHGLTVINYNCVILDTARVDIGAGAFIGPGVCLACSGHAIDPRQRAQGIGSSRPITLGENVWIGANATICGGVTIGDGSIIGAGAVVTRDIPAGVIAAGNPCRVLREITEADILQKEQIFDPGK